MKKSSLQENILTAHGWTAVGAMEKAEALALISEMLRGEPAARGAVSDLLRHPWWPEPCGVKPFPCAHFCHDSHKDSPHAKQTGA
jgi:hypothetical protein